LLAAICSLTKEPENVLMTQNAINPFSLDTLSTQHYLGARNVQFDMVQVGGNLHKLHINPNPCAQKKQLSDLYM
jgi:hypothetical protein